nr:MULTISPECIES: hypothetical protein [Asaia]
MHFVDLIKQNSHRTSARDCISLAKDHLILYRPSPVPGLNVRMWAIDDVGFRVISPDPLQKVEISGNACPSS